MILLKLHSRCNLDCTYCYVYHGGDERFLIQPKRIPWPVVERIPEMVAAECDRRSLSSFRLTFHGGEPLLVGKAFFRRMMEHFRCTLASYQIEYGLQTNGVLVDEEWVALFDDYGIRVGVSIDGPPGANGGHRIFPRGGDSTEAAIRGLRHLQRGRRCLGGVLCVVQPEADGRELVRFFADHLGLASIDFLLPDHTHDDVPPGWEARQRRLLEVMIDAFDEWSELAESGFGCRFFESIILGLVGRPSRSEAIGYDGVDVAVVEADGALAAHDVLRICRGVERFPGISVGAGAIEALLASDVYRAGLPGAHPLAPQCARCDERTVCQGGYFPTRYSRRNGFANPSVHCHVLYGLIQHVRRRLAEAPLPEVVERALAASRPSKTSRSEEPGWKGAALRAPWRVARRLPSSTAT